MFTRNTASRTLTLAALAGLALASGPAAAKTAAHAPAPTKPVHDFSGVWDSSYGVMNIHQDGAAFTGDYPQNHGRVAATVKGNVAHGIWAQSTGATRCSTMKLDSYYWGKIEFIAQPGGKRFEGSWSFCDGPYGAAWEGTQR